MSSNKKVKQQKPPRIKSDAIALPSSASTLATNHLKELFDAVPPARLKKELLDVFLIFLEHNALPANFTQMVSDYYMLFHFLDKMQEVEEG